mgnify:CR=1 FL=1
MTINADDPLVLEMRRHCSGNVILFTMEERHELVERWVHRGRKAVTLQKGDLGEMMVIREGRRTMPIAWVHRSVVSGRRSAFNVGAQELSATIGKRGRHFDTASAVTPIRARSQRSVVASAAADAATAEIAAGFRITFSI